MKLTEKRRTAIYAAVHDRMMDLRVQIARLYVGNDVAKHVDELLFKATNQAGQAAIQAAETGRHERSWRADASDPTTQAAEGRLKINV